MNFSPGQLFVQTSFDSESKCTHLPYMTRIYPCKAIVTVCHRETVTFCLDKVTNTPLFYSILSHKLALATFKDNKIQSTELTPECDEFIHILYGVFYSWISKNI